MSGVLRTGHTHPIVLRHTGQAIGIQLLRGSEYMWPFPLPPVCLESSREGHIHRTLKSGAINPSPMPACLPLFPGPWPELPPGHSPQEQIAASLCPRSQCPEEGQLLQRMAMRMVLRTMAPPGPAEGRGRGSAGPFQ